jgi:hypothetical protein
MFADYRNHVLAISSRLKDASLAAARQSGKIIRYVPPSENKQKIARQIALEQNIKSGLVCVLSSV